jgi:hypothetical protein
MGMLEGQIQFVIGVDTHTAAVCDPTGAVLVHATVTTSTAGHRQLLGWAQRHASGARMWAGGAGPRAPGPAARPWRARGAAGAAGHPPLYSGRPHQGHQPA